jgi:hypothetical protein
VSVRGNAPDPNLVCPFVALEDDRDGRASRPDHRHRCYAEARPAPRAIAHQDAYCLSASFASCTTFRDWARREAAALRSPAPEPPSAGAGPVSASAAVATAGGWDATEPSVGETRPRPGDRDWAAPPPWLGEPDGSGEGSDREPDEAEPARAPEPERAPGPPPPPSFVARSATDRSSSRSTVDIDDELESMEGGGAVPDLDDEGGREPPMRRFGPAARDSRRDRRAATPERRRPPVDPDAPAWERPRRFEAYPTLRTRAGIPSIPPIVLGLLGLGLVALILFFVPPLLLGLGDDGATTSPTPSVAASPSPTAEPSPTPTPAPTPFIYTVKSGDTLSGIAAQFGVTLDALIAANADTLPDPDKLDVGDKLVIPTPQPDVVPGEPSPSP